MTKSIFITATGTDVGKTYITGLLAKKLNENVYLRFKIISLLNPIKFLKLKSIIKFLGFMNLTNEGKIKKRGIYIMIRFNSYIFKFTCVIY